MADPDSCDPDVFERGTSACLVDIPKDAAEIICRGISAATGCKIDWHSVGGRVHIKALYTAPPAPVEPEWTNQQCLEFLSIAFRHAEIKGDFELDDLRLGVKMANAMTPGKEG